MQRSGELLALIRQQNTARLAELQASEQGIDLECVDSAGMGPLQIACQVGNDAIVRLLLQSASQPQHDLRDLLNKGAGLEKITCLAAAAAEGHDAIVQLLLSTRAVDVNRATSSGASALYKATTRGHAEVVSTLLRGHADPNQATFDTGSTPCLIAAELGRTEAFLRLARFPGTDLNKANFACVTPLICACLYGRVEMVRALLAPSAPPAPSISSAAAGAAASAAGAAAGDSVASDAELVEPANTSNNNITHITNNNNTHNTTTNNNNTHNNSSSSIDVNAEAYGLGTALYCVCTSRGVARSDVRDIVEMLLATDGIDVNKEEKSNGNTALMAACRSNLVEVVETIVYRYNTGARFCLDGEGSEGSAEEDEEEGEGEDGVGSTWRSSDISLDINQSSYEGDTALIVSARRGHRECLQILLSCPLIDVNATNLFGLSALCVACRKSHLACVRLLLEHPASDWRMSAGKLAVGATAEVKAILDEFGVKGRGQGELGCEGFLQGVLRNTKGLSLW